MNRHAASVGFALVTYPAQVAEKVMPPRAVVAADNSSVTAGGEAAQQRAERVRGFTETRFGMFIRIPVSEDEKFAAQFNPEKFDAREGVQIAKNAGMK